MAQEQLGITDTKEALAAVCHDWLDMHGVSAVRPNPFRMAQLIAEEIGAEEIEPGVEDEEEEEDDPLAKIFELAIGEIRWLRK